MKKIIACDLCPNQGEYGKTVCAFIHAGDEELCDIYTNFKTSVVHIASVSTQKAYVNEVEK